MFNATTQSDDLFDHLADNVPEERTTALAVIPNTPPADELAALREQMRTLKRREDELRALMLSDPAARTGNRFVALVQTTRHRRVDLDRLRRDYPEVADAVTVDVALRQVRLSTVTEDGEVVRLHPPPSWVRKRAAPRRARRATP